MKFSGTAKGLVVDVVIVVFVLAFVALLFGWDLL